MRHVHLRHAHGQDESWTPGRQRIFCGSVFSAHSLGTYGIPEPCLPAAHTRGWRGIQMFGQACVWRTLTALVATSLVLLWFWAKVNGFIAAVLGRTPSRTLALRWRE